MSTTSVLNVLTRIYRIDLNFCSRAALKIRHLRIRLSTSFPPTLILQVSLCQCAQTCRLFRTVTGDPQLYTRLCLKSVFRSVSVSALRQLAPRCAFVSELDLSWCGNYGKLTAEALGTGFGIMQYSCCQNKLRHPQ